MGWILLVGLGWAGAGAEGRERSGADRYVAEQFEAMGLEPAGEDDTYFQVVPLRQALLDESGSATALVGASGEVPLVHARDLLLSKSVIHESASVDGPLVSVGYGVTAPEFGYDDYSGIDVRAKILVMLRGAPPRFPPQASLRGGDLHRSSGPPGPGRIAGGGHDLQRGL